MRTFEYICVEIASSGKQPLSCFAKTEIESNFNRVFYSYITKMLIRFRHKYTVLSLLNYPR